MGHRTFFVISNPNQENGRPPHFGPNKTTTTYLLVVDGVALLLVLRLVLGLVDGVAVLLILRVTLVLVHRLVDSLVDGLVLVVALLVVPVVVVGRGQGGAEAGQGQ